MTSNRLATAKLLSLFKRVLVSSLLGNNSKFDYLGHENSFKYAIFKCQMPTIKLYAWDEHDVLVISTMGRGRCIGEIWVGITLSQGPENEILAKITKQAWFLQSFILAELSSVWGVN